MQPHLNWREIEHLATELEREIKGLFIEKVIVPHRPNFKGGFIKQEWGMRLTGTKKECAFLFSVRPQHPYFMLLNHKGPKASEQATRSGFDLLLHKELSGKKITQIKTIQNERSFEIHIDPYILVFHWIPAHPEALLVKEGTILGRTRKLETGIAYHPLTPPTTLSNASIRPEIAHNLHVYQNVILKSLEQDCYQSRAKLVEQEIKQTLKKIKNRITQTKNALRDAQNEPHYQYWGDLLKPVLGTKIEPQNGFWCVTDWETSQQVQIPEDPKLNLSDTVKKMYQLEGRKKRRIEEAKTRLSSFESRQAALLKLASSLQPLDFKTLSEVENQIGLSIVAEQTKTKSKKQTYGWDGYTFYSKEGLAICVGRSRDENLELTFKHTNGNDLWLHARGRPSSHVVILLRTKKTASLETLLDACYLLIHYSKMSGKCEIDYTQKKYVKRIKDSTEASYTHNKTLIVEQNESRLKELLGQQS